MQLTLFISLLHHISVANSCCKQTPALLPFLANGNRKYYFLGKLPLLTSMPVLLLCGILPSKVTTVLQSCCYKTYRQEQAATQNSAKEAAHSTRHIFNSSVNWRIFLHLHSLAAAKHGDHDSIKDTQSTGHSPLPDTQQQLQTGWFHEWGGFSIHPEQHSKWEFIFHCQTVSKLRVSLPTWSNSSEGFNPHNCTSPHFK